MTDLGSWSYLAWNERIARFWLMRDRPGGTSYLSVTPRALALLLWEHDGVEVSGLEAEARFTQAVRQAYRGRVLQPRADIDRFRGFAPTGDVPLCVAFLAASVLAAHRMREDGQNRANAYYVRLAQVLDVPLNGDVPEGFYKEGFEALWHQVQRWTEASQLPRLFLPKNQGTANRYVAIPMAHTELREVDIDRLTRFFDWAGYAPHCSVALDRLRADFHAWYPRHLTAQGRAACEDARLDGVLNVVAQELAAWDGLADDENGRHVAQVELGLEFIRGTPHLQYLARRPPGFPDVFNYRGYRFDSLDEGWYDPVPVPRDDGRQLLSGFEWTPSGGGPFVLRRLAARAISFVTSEHYAGLVSRRRLLAGIECAVLYHDSVSSLVEERIRQISSTGCNPLVSRTLPVGWRLLPQVVVSKADSATVPDHPALEVDSAVELFATGGLRVGRRAAWLAEAPPSIVVAGNPAEARVDSRPLVRRDSDARGWPRSAAQPGHHVVEAGRAQLRVELVEATVAEGLASLPSGPSRDQHLVALPRGEWSVLGRNPGSFFSLRLERQQIAFIPFLPVWGIQLGKRGVVLYLESSPIAPGEQLDDLAAVEHWSLSVGVAVERNMPLACLDPSACESVRSLWDEYVCCARRLFLATRGEP